MGVALTIGHGTRTTAQLAEVLRRAGAGRLIDVRRFPASRRHPHLAREALESDLPACGIAYEWRGEQLGGRRNRKRRGSRHSAWRNQSFQSYADHMDTAAFRDALVDLERAAQGSPPLALMCAETLWWRCHRRLIADALVLRGTAVLHLVDRHAPEAHKLHPSVRADEGGWPVYDVGEPGRLELNA